MPCHVRQIKIVKKKKKKNRAAKPQISFGMKTIETSKNNDSGKHYTRKPKNMTNNRLCETKKENTTDVF